MFVRNILLKNQNELSKNKLCSWTEVECLGSCVSAPMMQINQDYFEDFDEKKTEEIIQMLLNDNFPKPGSYRNRKNTAPEKGRTTLLEIQKCLVTKIEYLKIYIMILKTGIVRICSS